MKDDNLDVGFIDDAINVLQNQINAENHAINSYNQTKNYLFLEIAQTLRHDRSQLLYKMVKENNGESYCLTKHILACANGYKELGNRMSEAGNKELAIEYFEKAETYEKIVKIINDKGGTNGI